MGHTHSNEPHLHNTIDWVQVGHGNQTVANMAYLCLGVNIVLSVAKGVAGVGWGSSSLLADAVHSASDTISDLATMLCLYKAKQKPTARYPLGYGKMETLGAFFISCMLLSGSVSIGIHALVQMLERLAPVFPWLEQVRVLVYQIPDPSAHGHAHEHGPVLTEPRAILFVIMNLIIKEMMYRAMRRTARQTRSTMLEASAQHQRSESSASIMSLLALSGSWAGYSWLDPLGGMARAIHNGADAWRLLVRSLEHLCNRSADVDVLQAMEKVLTSAAAQSKESQIRPAFTWSDLAVVPNGPFLVVFVTLYFERHVALQDAAATEEWVGQRMRVQYPEVRGAYLRSDDPTSHQVVDTSAIELRNAVRVARVGRRLVAPRETRGIEALLGLRGGPRADAAVSGARTYLRSGLKYIMTANAATPPYIPQYQMFSHASFTRFVPGAGG